MLGWNCLSWRIGRFRLMSERSNLAIKPVSRRPGLEADMQPMVALCQSLDRSLNRPRAVLDLAEKPDLPGPAPLRDRDGVLFLGDIKGNKNFPWSALRA